MMYSKRMLYWTLLAAAALAVAFAPLPPDMSAAHHATHTFDLDARQFAYSPSVLSVAAGDTVTINLRSMDVVHGLYLDGYGLSMQAEAGHTSTLTFVANRSGTYRFRCSVTCGPMHPFMIGELHVGTEYGALRGMAMAMIGLAGIALAPIRRPGDASFA